MNEELLVFIEKLKKQTDLFNQSEEACRQFAVLPILKRLGWDTEDMSEVCPEYSAAGGRVDYCLKSHEKERVFIEVKKAGTELDKENIQEQLLKYAFDRGIELAILTDGFVWRLYLPLSKGAWASRCFYVVDVRKQELDSVADKLFDLLSKTNVDSGLAVEQAVNIHESKERERVISEAIPKAWFSLINEPDEILIELLQERVESTCGYRPENNVCCEFIVKQTYYSNSTAMHRIPANYPLHGPKPSEPSNSDGSINQNKSELRQVSFSDNTLLPSFDQMKLVSFNFRGYERSAVYWWEVLVGVCEIINMEQGKRFSIKVLDRYGRQKTGISKSKDDIRLPRAIPGTDLFVCVEFSASAHISRTLKIMELMEYAPSELSLSCIGIPTMEPNDSISNLDGNRESYSRPSSFMFLGKIYHANNRRDISRKLCTELTKYNPEKTTLLLNIQGRTRKYFSRHMSELEKPKLIPGTNIYLNDVLTTYEWQSLEPRLLKLFGLSSSDFIVDINS